MRNVLERAPGGRALVRKLFEERGFERATAGAAPSLQVDLIAFDELRLPHVHGARVEVRYQIRGPDAVIELAPR